MTIAVAAPPRVEGLTVGAFLSQWLAHVGSRVRPTTLAGYESLVRINAVPLLGDLALGDLHPLDLQGLYAGMLERGVSAGTVLNMHLVLTNAFGQAERWGLLARNPAAGAQPPRPERPEPASIDPSLAARLLEQTIGTRFELPVALALATGMRRGEILALRWSDLDPQLTVAHVRRSLQATREGLRFAAPKTRRSRRAVQLPTFVRPQLERERDRQAEVRASGACRGRKLSICHAAAPWYSLISPPSTSQRSIRRIGTRVGGTSIASGAARSIPRCGRCEL